MKKETYGMYRELIGNAMAYLDNLISLRKKSRALLANLGKEANDGSSPEERIRQAVMLEECAWEAETEMQEAISLISGLFDRDVTKILRKYVEDSEYDYDSFIKGQIQLWMKNGSLYLIPPKAGRIPVTC